MEKSTVLLRIYALTVYHGGVSKYTDHIKGKPDNINEARKLTKLGVNFNRLLRILECLRKGSELGVTERAVVVSTGIVRVPFDTLRICLHGASEVARLEECIALLACLFAQLRVNVRRALGGLLLLFRVTQLV